MVHRVHGTSIPMTFCHSQYDITSLTIFLGIRNNTLYSIFYVCIRVKHKVAAAMAMFRTKSHICIYSLLSLDCKLYNAIFTGNWLNLLLSHILRVRVQYPHKYTVCCIKYNFAQVFDF